MICIKNSRIPEYLSPINDLEAYDSTEESIEQFLKDLFLTGKFTGGDILNPDLLSSDKRKYISAYKDISERFSSTPSRSDYLAKRLTIGPLSQSAHGKRQLEGTPISGNKETMDLFELDCCCQRYWKDVYVRFHNEQNDSWVDDIELTVNLLNNRAKPRRLLRNFKSSDNRRFYPVLSRIDRIDDEPDYLYVIFIGSRYIEDQINIENKVINEPGIHTFINGLINIFRLDRWQFIEPFIAALKYPDNLNENHDHVYNKIKNYINNMGSSDHDERLRLFQVVKHYFPVEHYKKLGKCYADNWSHKKKIFQAIDEKDVNEVINILEEWRVINKELLKLSINRYLELSDLLEPL